MAENSYEDFTHDFRNSPIFFATLFEYTNSEGYVLLKENKPIK